MKIIIEDILHNFLINRSDDCFVYYNLENLFNRYLNEYSMMSNAKIALCNENIY